MSVLNAAAHREHSRLFTASEGGAQGLRAQRDAGALRQTGILAAMKNASAHVLVSGRVVLSMMARPLMALHRLLAGPPMSERGRFNYAVTEARSRTHYGLTSAWFRPR